jgi:signal transduction histidine kinase
MTTQQLTALLNALDGPARICDEEGGVVAQNAAAATSAWSVLESHPAQSAAPFSGRRPPAGPPLEVESIDLGDGYHLCRQKPPATAAPRKFKHVTDLESLLSGLLHEIRNPLSSILTAANLVQSTSAADLAEENSLLLGVIKKESLRMNRILTEFSAYVKLSQPRLDSCDLCDAARSVVTELRRDGLVSDEVAIDDQLPVHCMVYADEAQLHGALRQVVQNAAEAMGDSGQLQLTCRLQPSDSVLCIADSGPGFTAEGLQKAFQPFYSTRPQGTGLGLSMARALVEASHGRIWIEGEGAMVDALGSSLNASSANGAPLNGASSKGAASNGATPNGASAKGASAISAIRNSAAVRTGFEAARASSRAMPNDASAREVAVAHSAGGFATPGRPCLHGGRVCLQFPNAP